MFCALIMYTEHLSSPSPPTANSVEMCHLFLFHTCSLYGNHYGDDGLHAVAEGIKNCKELKEFQ